MSNRRAEVVILCEDTQHEVFLRRYLLKIGFPSRRIRVQKSSLGRGAGDQFVRKRYPFEVREFRRRRALMKIGLAVMVDADTRTVVERHQELSRRLEESALQPRGDAEEIAILVPKRNIETWIHHLLGKTVDEETDYPRLGRPSECKAAVLALSQWSDCPRTCPPSLQEGWRELRRLPQ
jgi:hypothetical protein